MSTTTTETTADATIEIVYVESDTELHHRYRGQTSAQDCYVWLNCKTSKLGASHDAEIGNAVPFAVHHGHTQRWSIPALKADAANALLEEIAPLAARVVAGYSSEWDGSNHVANFNADAEAAREEIEALCERATNGADESDTVNVWEASAWYSGVGSRDQQRDALKITAETTDAELGEIETREDASAKSDGCDMIEGHADYLRSIRDEAIDEAIESGDVVRAAPDLYVVNAWCPESEGGAWAEDLIAEADAHDEALAWDMEGATHHGPNREAMNLGVHWLVSGSDAVARLRLAAEDLGVVLDVRTAEPGRYGDGQSESVLVIA